jgi:hypothetical protein
MSVQYSFEARLWMYPGDAAWFFITLPKTYAKEIKGIVPRGRGFGSVRVNATIGKEAWKTSLFPDSKSGSYVLPVKKAIREKNNLQAGVMVRVGLELLV